MRLYSQVNYRNVPKIDNDEIAFNFKTIRNSPSGIPGNWDSLNSRSGIPGNFKIFWFVKKYLCKMLTKYSKIRLIWYFASVICITITKAHTSHLHTLPGQPDRPTYLTVISHRNPSMPLLMFHFLSRVRWPLANGGGRAWGSEIPKGPHILLCRLHTWSRASIGQDMHKIDLLKLWTNSLRNIQDACSWNVLLHWLWYTAIIEY